MTCTAPSPVVVADEVRAAVADGHPVIALESTIFTHGLPRPQNLQVALAAERQLRTSGVVPATIGVVDGEAVVGLSPEQIERLSQTDSASKISLRDLPVARAKRLSGGTTVAATAYLAHKARVRVFSTGGLGGVHVRAASTFDESADLPVLARTPILVVSAGVKSILDIGASLERMETLSVTVVGYKTTAYPGFYVADSGHQIEYSLGGPAEAAELIRARDAFGIAGAIVVANPVPVADQLSCDEHRAVLADAWHAAETAEIAGNDTTPFLLDYIRKATNGRSLDVNVAVYRNNVGLGGEIALALADNG
ncbi:MAG: pseudouridine-5'-phosphate glycosidase [Sciscionella sp.]